MKPMPDAREHRRLAEIENAKAEQLPAGEKKNRHLLKAEQLEAHAHSSDWRQRSGDPDGWTWTGRQRPAHFRDRRSWVAT
jgi:hypothetical protein